MPDQAPNIDMKPGDGGRLVYDKERRTIVAERNAHLELEPSCTTAPVTVEMSFNALKVRFGDVTHLRIDATKLVGHQSWREGYGNRKFVIEYTTTAGQIVCEYDTEDKWVAILAGLDKALDAPVTHS